MPKTPRLFDVSNYVPVAERVAAFYEQYPNGRIVTRLVERTTSIVIVRASAYRSHTDRAPSATGWAAERPGYGEINTVASLENAETSAVGRALANLGLHAARRTPAAADRTATAAAAANDRRPASAQSLGIATIYEAPVFHSVPPTAPGIRVSPPSGGDLSHVAHGNPDAPSHAVRDVARLLDDAERHGMRHRRAVALRRRVESHSCAAQELEHLEAFLRAWIRKPRR